MKRLLMFVILCISLLLLAACVREPVVEDAFGIPESAVTLDSQPFKNLAASDITSASVELLPPGETVEITDLSALTELLNKVVIYEEFTSKEMLYGQSCKFTITKSDGSVITIHAMNLYVAIDDVRYRCEYEPCEALSAYANGLLNSESN